MRRNIDMLHGSLYKGILSYTIPIMLTSLLQLLFNAADLVIVGQYCGSISVAAVSATGAITNLIVNLFIGLSVGCGVTVAHGLGGQHNEEVHRIVHTALPTALAGGAFAYCSVSASVAPVVSISSPSVSSGSVTSGKVGTGLASISSIGVPQFLQTPPSS